MCKCKIFLMTVYIFKCGKRFRFAPSFDYAQVQLVKDKSSFIARGTLQTRQGAKANGKGRYKVKAEEHGSPIIITRKSRQKKDTEETLAHIIFRSNIVKKRYHSRLFVHKCIIELILVKCNLEKNMLHIAP